MKIENRFRRIILLTLLGGFAILLAPSGGVMAGPPEGKGRIEKSGNGKGSGMEDEDSEKGKGVRDKKKIHADKKSPENRNVKKIKGLERKIERLTVIADDLERKGKTEQAARLREKIQRAREMLAEKQKKIKSDGGDDSDDDSDQDESDDDDKSNGGDGNSGDN